MTQSGNSLSGTRWRFRARVKEIPAEIERETAAVQSKVRRPKPRMFPVAVTFLVPEKFAAN